MGILDVLKGAVGGKGKSTLAGKKFKCPSCGAQVTLDMERCPSCGVRIKSMFKKKCPKCKELNDLDANVCEKCGFSFKAEMERAKKTVWRCPICGYEMGGYMTRCPVCRTRFV